MNAQLPPLRLTDHERAMLAGEAGPASRLAMFWASAMPPKPEPPGSRPASAASVARDHSASTTPPV